MMSKSGGGAITDTMASIRLLGVDNRLAEGVVEVAPASPLGEAGSIAMELSHILVTKLT